MWIDGFLSLATWDVTGNKKAVMLGMRIYDYMMYLVNCYIAAHLQVIKYQISSSYFTLENKDDLKGKGCTQFLPLQFLCLHSERRVRHLLGRIWRMEAISCLFYSTLLALYSETRVRQLKGLHLLCRMDVLLQQSIAWD